MEKESLEFDVIIVGAGPAGLSAAIRLAQIDPKLSICVLEKAAEIGGQILSGAVLEPRALDELLPDWKTRGAPISTPVIKDQFLLLTKNKTYSLPTPKPMHNQGNYIISLGKLCRWLAEQAELLGVNVIPGFAATEIIFENNYVKGVMTGDKGVDKNGNPTSLFQPGMIIRAKQTLLGEGCRGSLSQSVIQHYHLADKSSPQTYGLGIKELWEIPRELHQEGLVTHTIGWPLDNKTYGGTFAYHLGENLLELGLVIGLDYQNPYLNPYEEFQRFKMHPSINKILTLSKRIAYGARALNEGGWQSLPKLTFPGGMLIGCSAGFLNVPKIKGIHTAMKSGMIAAESLFPLLQHNDTQECLAYEINLKSSWIAKELYAVRNIRPAMTWGLWPGLIYSALDTYLLKGHAPWTFSNHADYKKLQNAKACKKIEYPKHDNCVSFDLMSSVFLTNAIHDENQPCHLKLKDREKAISVNYKIYDSPETRYCPAGVYEVIFNEQNQPQFQINYANCIQCKACDIKDPEQNIVWTPPEGGSGPQYGMM